LLWQLKEDLEIWRNLQSITSELLGVSILLMDSYGDPVTEISHACNFCKDIRKKNPNICLDSNFQGAKTCIKEELDYLIYRCPYDLCNIVFPIYVDDRYAGALFIGQIKLIDKEEEGWRQPVANFDSINERFIYNKIDKEKLGKLIFYGKTITQLIVRQLEEKIRYGIYTSDFMDTFSSNSKKRTSTLSEAITLLHNQSTKVYKLAELSKELNYSASSLKKIFYSELGRSFSSYYTELKITNAKKLLKFTDDTTKSIALKLGYENPANLYKKFKRETGMTMTEYRKLNRATKKFSL